MAEKMMKDDTSLEVSYGKPIPQPKLHKGEFQVMGELSDSTNAAPPVDGSRSMTFGDGVKENVK